MWGQDVQNIVLAEFSPAAGTANLDALRMAMDQRYTMGKKMENMGKPRKTLERTQNGWTILLKWMT